MKDKLYGCILRNTSNKMVNMPSEIWKDILKWKLNDELVFIVEEVHHEHKNKIISRGLRIERKKDQTEENNYHLVRGRHIYDGDAYMANDEVPNEE